MSSSALNRPNAVSRTSLFPKIRKATRDILNGYIHHPKAVSLDCPVVRLKDEKVIYS